MSTFREVIEYCMRRLAEFERWFSPPKPKVIHHYHDATEYDASKVVHVHHYHHAIREEPMDHWERIYRNLLKGFQ